MAVIVNSKPLEIKPGERLIDSLNRNGIVIPQVCYHPQLGPIQTCDTCMVEMDGKLVRACGTDAVDGAQVETASPRARTAQREAFDHILGNHELYCTVCDNNNGNCTVHNTTVLLTIEHQETPFKSKPYRVDSSNPFYRYDPQQCILCGRCVEACQNLQVNETLSIRWEDRIRAFYGTEVRRSASRVASPVATASRSVPATHSWRRQCSARPATLPAYPSMR